MAGALSNLTLTAADQDGQLYEMVIDPTTYLWATEDDTVCQSLLSQSLDSKSAFILGTPFFRNKIVTLEF